jgi:omega-6 fatty acid desaturase (delta-12 desaturase)
MSVGTAERARRPAWAKDLARYARPDVRKALWQVVNTFVPYSALWAAMVWTVQAGLPYWLTLLLALPAAGFLVRIFIFFHDCGHKSFFGSKRANTLLGTICGVLTFTAFSDWTRAHAGHHGTVADLDRRGIGDVWTMTVEEYERASPLKKLAYRVVRNPVVLLGLGPVITFFLMQRLPHKGATRRDRRFVLLTNAAIALIMVLSALTIGVRTYLLIQVPVMYFAGVVGIWLFYVQHQFEGVYWARHDAWDPMRAALEGSSYYKLPKVLQWITGNIGLHHIHHVLPRIPNYHLQAAYDATPELQAARPVTLWSSLKSLRLNLYDEAQGKLVSFRSLRRAAQPE